MIDCALILLGGLLGSAHCVGMCGGFAISIGVGSRGVGENLVRQLVYGSGRISTYAFLGACAGFAGLWLEHEVGTLVDASAWLAIVAGVVLSVQAGVALGLVPQRLLPRIGGGASPCLVSPAVRPFLTSPRRRDVLLAGVLTGFLPCGLVYGYLALATSRGGLVGGMATMALFGSGTLPLMVLTGIGASLLAATARRQLLRIAACCVLVTGLMSVARGATALAEREQSAPERCPFCATADR